MFTTSITSVDLVGRHRERLLGAAERHRRVFGFRSMSARRAARHAGGPAGGPNGGTVTGLPLAEIVALPARVDRTSPRDSRVA